MGYASGGPWSPLHTVVNAPPIIHARWSSMGWVDLGKRVEMIIRLLCHVNKEMQGKKAPVFMHLA